jgi:hypothetical protein
MRKKNLELGLVYQVTSALLTKRVCMPWNLVIVICNAFSNISLKNIVIPLPF